MSSTAWYRSVLGGELARWTKHADDTTIGDEKSSDKPFTLVPVEEAVAEAEVVALYFPPLLGDDLVDRLAELHRRVNQDEEGTKVKAKFRVVQVLTPLPGALSPASPTAPRAPWSPTSPCLEVPWFAVPPHDFERQRRICGRFRVQADVALSRLLLLDGRSGRLVTRCGRERLLADPHGLAFPWPARPLRQVLASAWPGLGDRADLVIGVYFSAHWCPPCKAFTPQLISTYNAVRARGHNFEIIFVSSDRSEESFSAYARTMPWPAVSWAEEATRQELASLLAVQGIPTLVLVDNNGVLITDDARARVNDDPDGKEFPWRPEPVSVFSERHSARLHDHPALILFVEGAPGEVEWASAILKQASDAYEQRHPSSQASDALREPEPRLQFYVAQDGDAADSLREQLVLEDAVPLLVAVDVWRGAVSVLEDEADEDKDEDEGPGTISASSATAFMEAFLSGDLPSAPIGVYLPPPPRPHHALLQQYGVDVQPLEA